MKMFFGLILFFSASTQAADCTGHLQAVNIWEDEINGQIVLKNTQFAINDWDPNASFDGILLMAGDSKTLKNPSLEVEYISKSKSKKKLETFKTAKPFDQDSSQKLFDFEPKEFFSIRQAGTFTLKLKDGETVVCSQTNKFLLGH